MLTDLVSGVLKTDIYYNVNYTHIGYENEINRIYSLNIVITQKKCMIDSRVKYKLYSLVIADILKAEENGAFGGAFLLSFCCVDYFSLPLALMNNTERTGKDEFKFFIKNYMSQVNNKYSHLFDEFYAIRCSLVHTYGESSATRALEITPQFIFANPCDEHLLFNNRNNKLTISLSDFISELIAAIECFFKTKVEDEVLNIWDSKLYYPQNDKAFHDFDRLKNGENIPYNSIHKYLEIFDKEPDIKKCQKILQQLIEDNNRNLIRENESSTSNSKI